jgi:hypothetical protein
MIASVRRSLTLLAAPTVALLVVALLVAACGGSGHVATTREASVRLPPDYVPISVGRGPDYRPGPLSAAARAGRPVASLTCTSVSGSTGVFGAHLEIFANDRVVAVPAGIGLAPPVTRDGASVGGGRCRYPIVTVDPTGVLVIRRDATLTLGQLFALWGQPLSRRRIGAFTATARQTIAAFLNGRPYRRDPRTMPLGRHARVVLEVRSHVLPHRVYLFPPGL